MNSADTSAIMFAISYQADLDVNMDGSVDTKDSSLVSRLSGRSLGAGQLSDSGNIVGWCGYLYEESTGMWLARHRWQIPELGRWANRDPIGYAGGGQNLYEYVNRNPIFLQDPSGLLGIPRFLKDAAHAVGNAVDEAATAVKDLVFGVDTGEINRQQRELHGKICGNLRDVLARDSRYDCQTDEDWEEQKKNAHHAYYVTHKCDGPAPVTDWGDVALQSIGETVVDAFTDPTEVLDNMQLALDGMGLFPVLGEVADGLSGVISLLRGDWVGVGLSAMAMVPFLGSTSGVAKIARNSTSGPRMVSDALTSGERFVGQGYREIGSGIWESTNGRRRFRMTDRDLIPTHGKIGPHVHFEFYRPGASKPYRNIHVPLIDP